MTRRTKPRTRRHPRAIRWFLIAFATACIVFLSSGCPASGGRSSEEEQEETSDRFEEQEVRMTPAPNYRKVRPAAPRARGSFRASRGQDPCNRKGVGGRPLFYCPDGRTTKADTVFLGQSRKR